MGSDNRKDVEIKMIYMREYSTKVNKQGEKDAEGRFPLVDGTYVYKTFVHPNPKVATYTWKNVREFQNQRCSRSHDFIGWLFGGVVCKLKTYCGIVSFQLFMNEDKFPETIEAPWFAGHMGAVSDAWHKCQTTMYQYTRDDKGDRVDSPEHLENAIRLKELRAMKDKDFQEQGLTTA